MGVQKCATINGQRSFVHMNNLAEMNPHTNIVIINVSPPSQWIALKEVRGEEQPLKKNHSSEVVSLLANLRSTSSATIRSTIT